MQVGELVGRGRTSDVFAYGTDSVVKIPHDDVPSSWPQFEAVLTQAVHSAGVSAPAVRDVVVVSGRASVVFERIAGPSMWQQMLDTPADAPRLARELAAIQKSLLAVGIPPDIPELVDRLARNISVAPGLSADEQTEAVMLAEGLPRGAALLHGDLHPGNVLMGANGAVVIDWFDAAIGHPIADILRSSILMQPTAATAPRHLPGAPRALMHDIHENYLGEFRAELDMAASELASWQAVVAAARLAEGAEVNEDALLSLWAARSDAGAAHASLVRPGGG